VIGHGAQKAVARNNAMSTSKLVGSLCRDAVRYRIPSPIPAIVIPSCNTRRRGKHLTE
jgi:hypothetical protein